MELVLSAISYAGSPPHTPNFPLLVFVCVLKPIKTFPTVKCTDSFKKVVLRKDVYGDVGLVLLLAFDSRKWLSSKKFF